MTFDYLYNTVFPYLGDIFGRLSAVAVSPTYDVLMWLLTPSFGGSVADFTVLSFTNVFTGSVSTMKAPLLLLDGLGLGVVRRVIEGVASVIQVIFMSFAKILGLYRAPFWVYLLIITSSLFLLFALIKFVVDIVR